MGTGGVHGLCLKGDLHIHKGGDDDSDDTQDREERSTIIDDFNNSPGSKGNGKNPDKTKEDEQDGGRNYLGHCYFSLVKMVLMIVCARSTVGKMLVNVYSPLMIPTIPNAAQTIVAMWKMMTNTAKVAIPVLCIFPSLSVSEHNLTQALTMVQHRI